MALGPRQKPDRTAARRVQENVVLGSSASGQIQHAKSYGWQALATKPINQQFDLVA
jgi:hypothetical protein